MSSKPVDPIRKQLFVEAPQERCFRVYTENMASWWPTGHHIGKSPLKTTVMEPKVNGRWFEVGEDGSECNWGKVLVWDPPRKLVLAWQISADWKFDPALLTTIEVLFTPEGPQRTRIDFEHRDLDKFGPAAAGMRSQMDPGWGSNLELFKKAAQG